MIGFWISVLALTIFLYVALDGFDLGVGMLFAFDRSETNRRQMMSAIAPVWDGNETWLVLNATILFGAFPLTYSILMSAFYLPLMVMLIALVFRGVAFEFRARSGWTRPLWDFGFSAGSFIAAFIQGATIGALVQGLKVVGTTYAGGPYDWLSPFSLLCGIGLCIGYMLLGASWLVHRTEGNVQATAYRQVTVSLLGVILFLAAVSICALVLHLDLIRTWYERPVIFLFPAIGLMATAALVAAIRERNDILPILSSITIFAAAFGTLACSFFPFMIPPSITAQQAAAPPASLSFMFWGAGLFVLPITLVYTLVVYFVFKGKVLPTQEHY